MPETYPAGGAKNFIHGIDYQKLWLMLFFRRAVNRKYFFRLATEMSSAAGFDDTVFLDEQNGTTVCMLIQVKHKQDDSKKICVGDLLTRSGELNLVKHFAAFLEIQGNEEFKDKIKDFFIVINVDFDYESLASKGITVEKIETQDEFLNIGDSAKYKLRDLHNNIAQYLEQGMSAGGREVSDEKIRGFLNELVFVVNLPNDVELEKLIRNEINDDLARRFKYFGDNGYVFNALFTLMSSWMKDKRGRFLTPEEGEKFFREVEKLPSTLSEIKKSQDEIKCVVKRTEEKVDEIVRRKRTSTNGRRAREPIWFNMMEPVASFTGRSSELKALHDALQKTTGKQAVISQVASISGLGGVGKSELARKYTYKYGKDYYVNAIWIDAESTETMKNSFLDLANNRLGILTKDRHERDKTIENIVREVYAFFARRGRRSLFIFDNAEGYEDIKRFLPSSLHPRHKKPYILITSRNKDWRISEDEGEIKTIQLGVFKETEALKFVKRALNIRNNLQDEEIKNLTEELQYFPLALKQAVAYINEKNVVLSYRGKEKIGVSDYLKRYEEEAKKLLDFELKNKSDRYTKTTFITWKITIDAIAQKECGFEALSILEIMAYLAPDKICVEEIFSKLIADDEEKLWNAVKLLDRYSMIDLKEGVANIHRLVQKVTELNLQKEDREEEVLRRALELINSGNIVKDSTIHVASIWGYASKHGRLIDDFYKDTNLHLLVENDDYKAIKNLLAYIKKKHQDKLSEIVNAKDGCGIAPLHLAAGNGKLDIVKYLINKGASIDARDCFYQTPLYWAAKSGELDMVKYLVNKGASVDIEDSYGWTALYWAVENENFYIAEYLIKEKGIDVSARYSNGKTMLHEAIRFAKLDAVRYLIGKGIDIDIKDGYGGTPLHWAAIREKIDMVRYFIEQGADVNAKDNDDLTSLHWAVLYANLKVVRCLVEDGSDVDAKDKRGWTPLHLIAKNNLLLWGDDLNEMLGTTEYLIQENADVNTKDENGNTALHLAVIRQKVDITKTLLKYNADVNSRNNLGNTVLDCAVDNCQELVELLLAHGASYDY